MSWYSYEKVTHNPHSWNFYLIEYLLEDKVSLRWKNIEIMDWVLDVNFLLIAMIAIMTYCYHCAPSVISFYSWNLYSFVSQHKAYPTTLSLAFHYLFILSRYLFEHSRGWLPYELLYLGGSVGGTDQRWRTLLRWDRIFFLSFVWWNCLHT